ncbi:MAG TPA: serine/threonine-protein kinase [Verrucomicrobiae bacterium]
MSQHDKHPPSEPPAIDRPRIPDHELLRPIGGGSYGTVWLARNTVGTFRAVKVVERASFNDARPYEREYEGLKLFEPVSRTHGGLVDILHLGRDDIKGCFYYVMEAADDVSTGQKTNPANYTPRTLEHEIKRCGRLPVSECLELSVALADALAFLHRNKLVHRDLKPSNIVFVNGVPKVADVGLVAQAGAATFVGSEGFVAPEGPGKPQADLYSLGKVIYEMAMGKDRQAFPSPPTQLAELPDRKELVELNEIIAQACEPDPRRRYQSAEDLKAELALLQHGGRPSQARRRRALVTGLAKVAAAALLALTVVFAGGSLKDRWQLKVLSTFAIPGVKSWQFAEVGHFDDDGIPDVFVTASNRLYVRSVWGTNLLEWHTPDSTGEYLYVELAPNFYHNGQEGLFLNWRDNRTNLNLALVGGTNFLPKVFARMGGLDPGGESGSSSLFRPRIVDLEQDGRRQLIALLGTSYGTGPRGVCCFDFDNTRLLWEFLTAPSVQSVEFVHLTNDTGPLDLVFGGDSPNNHKTWGEGDDRTDDGHCYLYAISGKGQKLWRKELGGEYTKCRPVHVRNTGKQTKEIIAAVWRYLGQTNDIGALLPEVGRIVRVDQRGTLLSEYDAGAAVVSFIAADLVGDDAPEILATDRFGRLHILDSQLKLISRTRIVRPHFHHQLDRVDLHLEAVEDLNGDGRKELVFHSSQVEWISGLGPKGGDVQIFHDNCVLALDARLRELARYTIAREHRNDPAIKVVVSELARNGRKALVVFSDRVTVLELARK